MKKIFVFLICLLIASPAFAKELKSPLLKLPKILQIFSPMFLNFWKENLL